jgi:hypothetical protein
MNDFWNKYNPFNAEGRENIFASFRNFWQGENATQLRNTISGFFKYLVEEILLAVEGILPTFGRAQQVREERAVAAVTPDDRNTAAIATSTEDLTNSQETYRDMLDEAVNLQRTLNRLGQDSVDPFGSMMISDYQIQLEKLIERLPDGAESDIQLRAEVSDLMQEYERQLRKSQDRLWTGGAGRAAAATEVENILQQLESLEVDTSTLPRRSIGTLQATGFRSEPRDTVAQIHAGERVLNPQETSEYNNRQSNSNQTDMIKKLDQLNNTMMTVASLISQELSIQTRTMNNISGLGPDLMKGIPG